MAETLLPPEILQVLQQLRPVFHQSSWASFLYLCTGLLLGQAQAGIVRASLLAPKEYNWRRLPDLVRRNRWSAIELMIRLTHLLLTQLYPEGFPPHLFWTVDGTYLEKMYAQAIEDILIHHRPHPKAGQSRRLKGHGLLVVAHLYQQTAHRFRALVLGGLLYVKQATWVELSAQALTALPLPTDTHNIVLIDRGLTSRKLVRPLQAAGLYLLGRLKRNACFYLPATEADYKGKGRRPYYGAKYRADALPAEYLTRTEMSVPVSSQLHAGVVYRGTFLRRGWPTPVELIRVEVGNLPPWLLGLTDPTLSTEAAVWAYYGRSQMEVAIGEAKVLGLDQYRGRRHAGISRWPMLIGVVHSLLQLLAVGALHLALPAQNWPWYHKETTVGAIQRRLLQWVWDRHFFHLCGPRANSEKMAHAA